MDLELTRIDYGNVGTTSPNCLKLLPAEYKKQQKVVLGDLDGNLQIFSIKKSEAQVSFQSYVGQKVACIQLGGAPGKTTDKIFVATDNVVKGFNKKGKMFLSFDTNLTEPIKCMFISGADLITCGNHVYSHYRDCKDIGTYLCGDTIVDVVALCPNNTNRILTILACSGRVLRILEHCRVRQTVELDSVPTTLHVPKSLQGDRVLCGFADGKVVMFSFGHFTGEVKQQTVVQADENPSAVTCIDTYDMENEGTEQLIIGRRDGTVQVFTLPTGDELEIETRQLFRECFPESISAVQAGCVYSNGFVEIVVLSYAGSVFGLTTQVISVSLSDKEVIKKTIKKETNWIAKEGQLDGDEDVLGISLVKPKENYRLSTQVVTRGISSMSIMEANTSLTLRRVDACTELFIEMPSAISNITFQGDVALKITDLDQESFDVADNDTKTLEYAFNMRINFKKELNKFEITFETVEGQYGSFEAYIQSSLHIHNAQEKLFFIKPLSLHIRTHSIDAARPFNTLTLKGSFSNAEIHNWIEQCIPEVPERLSVGDSTELFFENVFVGSVLTCNYGKGSAKFRSDNLSTISILKDFLTKEATKKRIKLEILPEINEASIPHILKLLEPKIQTCLKKKNDQKYLRALLQLDLKTEEEFNCLMPEYQSILNRREEIEKDFESYPATLRRYIAVVTDFYVDRFKFKGIFVKEKIPQLVDALENFDLAEVTSWFSGEAFNSSFQISHNDYPDRNKPPQF